MSVNGASVPARYANAPHYKWLVTATVMLGMMGTVMSSTMLNVAIPNIMGTYGIGQDEAHWMSTATLAAMPVMMLMNGWFVSNFGARNTYVGACSVFCIVSAVGQFMPEYYGLVLVRTVQGACTGLLQPLTMTLMFPLFSQEERGKAMGIYGMGFILGPALGPTLGGLIVDHWHWQDAFGSSIPLMLVAVVMGWRLLPSRDSRLTRAPLNWVSLVLIAVALGTFLTAISSGARVGWNSLYVYGLFLTSASCFLAFVSVELTTRFPLLQVRLFKVRTFAISVGVGFTFGAGMFGSMYVLPVFAQTVLGYTAFKAGLLLMLSALFMIPVFPVGGRLAQQPRSGIPIAVGMLMFGVSSLALAGADTNTAFWLVAFWATFGRAGLGLALPSLQVGALRELTPELLPYGAGTLNFVRMSGAAMGTGVLAIVLNHQIVVHGDQLSATQSERNSSTVELLDTVGSLLVEQGVSAAEQAPLAMHYLARMITAQATGLAFKDGFMLLALCFLVAALSALALAKKPKLQKSDKRTP